MTQNFGEANGRTVLNPRKVRMIRKRYAGGFLLKDLAEMYGVSVTCIHAIVKRRSWRWLDDPPD